MIQCAGMIVISPYTRTGTIVILLMHFDVRLNIVTMSHRMCSLVQRNRCSNFDDSDAVIVTEIIHFLLIPT